MSMTVGKRKHLMDKFIKTYPNYIPSAICDYFIKFFEKEEKVGATFAWGSGGNGVNAETKDSIDLCLRCNDLSPNKHK